jgi:hypothetical protein
MNPDVEKQRWDSLQEKGREVARPSGSLDGGNHSPAASPRRRFCGLLLGLEVLAGGLVDHLHRQPGLAAVVEAEQFYPDLVAFLDDIRGLLHAGGCELANVDKTVGAEEVHKGRAGAQKWRVRQLAQAGSRKLTMDSLHMWPHL